MKNTIEVVPNLKPFSHRLPLGCRAWAVLVVLDAPISTELAYVGGVPSFGYASRRKKVAESE